MTEILCINVGSSSVKTATFDLDGLRELTRTNDEPGLQLDAAANPAIVAHRFVHGGTRFDSATVISDETIGYLETLIPLAPLHMPPALEVFRQARAIYPEAKHIACFDTAFHYSIPTVAHTYALPNLLGDEVRKYGFHGLSCEHVVNELGAARTECCVIAHLGSGCSVTAVRGGLSVDTSMGFTPAGGVMMASRSGDLDPGLVLYLLRSHDSSTLAEVLNHESGLKAIAGSGDMESLLNRTDDPARLAIEMFCYRIAQFIGAYATTLGGIDTLAFTGGIGEHAKSIRDRIIESVEFLRPFEVAVVPANEEFVMARQALQVA